jgi:hypothetical protein
LASLRNIFIILLFGSLSIYLNVHSNDRSRPAISEIKENCRVIETAGTRNRTVPVISDRSIPGLNMVLFQRCLSLRNLLEKSSVRSMFIRNSFNAESIKFFTARQQSSPSFSRQIYALLLFPIHEFW